MQPVTDCVEMLIKGKKKCSVFIWMFLKLTPKSRWSLKGWLWAVEGSMSMLSGVRRVCWGEESSSSKRAVITGEREGLWRERLPRITGLALYHPVFVTSGVMQLFSGGQLTTNYLLNREVKPLDLNPRLREWRRTGHSLTVHSIPGPTSLLGLPQED